MKKLSTTLGSLQRPTLGALPLSSGIVLLLPPLVLWVALLLTLLLLLLSLLLFSYC